MLLKCSIAQAAVVMEDDVELSPDAFEWFDFAASRISSARALPAPQAHPDRVSPRDETMLGRFPAVMHL